MFRDFIQGYLGILQTYASCLILLNHVAPHNDPNAEIPSLYLALSLITSKHIWPT